MQLLASRFLSSRILEFDTEHPQFFVLLVDFTVETLSFFLCKSWSILCHLSKIIICSQAFSFSKKLYWALWCIFAAQRWCRESERQKWLLSLKLRTEDFSSSYFIKWTIGCEMWLVQVSSCHSLSLSHRCKYFYRHVLKWIAIVMF